MVFTKRVFSCIKCLRETLSALYLNDIELKLAMEGINYPEETNINDILLNDPQIEIINKTNAAINNEIYSSEDETESENEALSIDCKYYTTDEFNAEKFDPVKYFSILHI